MATGILTCAVAAFSGSALVLQVPALPSQPPPEVEGSVTAILLTFAVVALLGDRLLTWATRLGFSLGIDTSRTIGSHVRAVKWAGVLVLSIVLLRWLLSPLPGWASVLALLVLLVGVLGSTGILGDVLGGLLVHFRLGLREGDYIQVGERSGQVEDVQLLRLRLLTLQDGSVFVPNRRLLFHSVEVSPLRHAFPVEVNLALVRLPTDKQLVELREALMFLPYRVPSSPLTVRASVDGQRLTVHFHVWSHHARYPAEAWVRARCQQATSGEGSP